MNRLRLGCIADDYTGATDLASMLSREGLRVAEFFGIPREDLLSSPATRDYLNSADAVVIALKTRSCSMQDAVEQSLHAWKVLQTLGSNRYYFKYCSTFDSTPRGNIGPVAEALAKATGEKDVWYCPAFPENGRTVYYGHLFVHGVPLHESSMKDHPLTPMRESNLVRVLVPQCEYPVSLMRRNDLWHNASTACDSVTNHNWIVDSVDNADMENVAQLAMNKVFLTGGSAMGGHWAKALLGTHASRSYRSMDRAGEASASAPTVVLAGSCSNATCSQIRWFEEKGLDVYRVDVIRAAQDEQQFHLVVDDIVAWCEVRNDHRAFLICTGWDLGIVKKTSAALGVERGARVAESVFGRVARELADRNTRRFIVAGGETTGAVISALDVPCVAIGPEIAPGVPWAFSLGDPSYALALKSGNFGSDSFFIDAIDVLDKVPSTQEAQT